MRRDSQLARLRCCHRLTGKEPSMLEKFDREVSHWSEKAARRISRRSVLIKGAVAAISGVTIGEGFDLRGAEAACTCSWAMGVDCANTRACPFYGGCPSGCRTCVSGSPTYGCNGWCPYYYGNWVSCSGLGGGLGYMVCTDCDCNYRGTGDPPDCGNLCTCLSGCLNCETLA